MVAITILQKTGTAIILANTGEHSPAAGNNIGTRTDQIDLGALASGSFRQSTKIDFGAVRAAQWGGRAAIEWSVAPAISGLVTFHMSWSHSATAATGNDGNCTGADGSYVGYGAAASDADEAVKLLDFLGTLKVTNDADILIGFLNTFTIKERYGNLITKNATDQAFNADAIEMSIRLAPLEDEFQS